MRFQCIVATRHNPVGAAAVVQILHSLASGEHQIDYVVSYDFDDMETNHFFHHLKQVKTPRSPRIVTSSDKRPLGLGAVWNRAVDLTADYIVPMADDAFPSTPDWDEMIHKIFEESGCPPAIRVLAWNDLANQGQCTLPIVSNEWLKHVGQLYDERFPFWFYDTIVAELWSFITGRQVYVPLPLVLTSKKGLTQSMRDVPFWWSYYVALRPERLEKARVLREKMGVELPPWRLAEMVRAWEYRDNDTDQGRKYPSRMSADSGPPSERYMQIRALAAAHMLELGHRTFVETAKQIVEPVHAA